ncbi:hypothetical protein Ddye_006770 [Dipteronia dyeriana]|uniref:C2HC zinc finger plants domain-containing protein n=1 Tax=Dipteronia dyeriana TaxID=168575 RepID=A0AAE0CR02_9ROSI|nr:hypothetical protein Ddye_006770 [Dipteronia dyeriana]
MTNDMDRTDTEMMETESATATPQQNQGNSVRELLTLARQLINQGNPSQALQAVVMAMRSKGGEEAVFQSLHRARELYISRLQENTGVDQLAALFAECAIAEAQPLNVEPASCNIGNPSIALDADGTSILAESGRTQIVLDASSDGSSFICLQCGGLVSNHRKDEHYAYWCCNL